MKKTKRGFALNEMIVTITIACSMLMFLVWQGQKDIERAQTLTKQNYELFIQTTKLNVSLEQYLNMTGSEVQGYLARSK